MLTLERLAHPRRRQCTPARTTATPPRATGEPPSHILQPRTEDLDACWPAHACRCLRELPKELAWAAPLLDPNDPVAVLCGHEQTRRLFAWHQHLPTYQQVSFSCERLAHSTQSKPPR